MLENMRFWGRKVCFSFRIYPVLFSWLTHLLYSVFAKLKLRISAEQLSFSDTGSFGSSTYFLTHILQIISPPSDAVSKNVSKHFIFRWHLIIAIDVVIYTFSVKMKGWKVKLVIISKMFLDYEYSGFWIYRSFCNPREYYTFTLSNTVLFQFF